MIRVMGKDLLLVGSMPFDTAEQNSFCENLSFSPWHCLDDHRPLGGINRARRFVYQYISALRHELNQAPSKEPKDFDIDS